MVDNRDSDRFNTIQRELDRDIFDIRCEHSEHTVGLFAVLQPKRHKLEKNENPSKTCSK